MLDNPAGGCGVVPPPSPTCDAPEPNSKCTSPHIPAKILISLATPFFVWNVLTWVGRPPVCDQIPGSPLHPDRVPFTSGLMPHASTSNPNQLEHTESSVAQNDVEAASPLPNFQYNPLATPFTCSAAYHVCAAVSCDDTSASALTQVLPIISSTSQISCMDNYDEVKWNTAW